VADSTLKFEMIGHSATREHLEKSIAMVIFKTLLGTFGLSNSFCNSFCAMNKMWILPKIKMLSQANIEQAKWTDHHLGWIEKVIALIKRVKLTQEFEETR